MSTDATERSRIRSARSKVRDEAPPAGLLREQFIIIVKEVTRADEVRGDIADPRSRERAGALFLHLVNT